MQASSFMPKYSDVEARSLLEQFDRQGLLSLTNDKLSLPYFARAKLHDDLINALGKQGIPSPVLFFDILKEQEAVISGSFVPSFIDEPLRAADPGWHYLPRDVDIYVGRGRFEATLSALAELPGAPMRVLTKYTMPAPTFDNHGRIIPAPCPDIMYHNAAIRSMARVRYDLPFGKFAFLDVMESSSLSPIMPIARFNLTHLRRGISALGYFDLHPHWHGSGQTFTSPRLRTEITRKNAAQYFVDKYKERGIDVDESGVVSARAPHECAVSYECPLTLRNTADDGVFFAPFSDEGAFKASRGLGETLAPPVVYWKHGGKCSLSSETATPELFDGEGVDGERDVYVE